jgi:hypothetical protein
LALALHEREEFRQQRLGDYHRNQAAPEIKEKT